MAQTNNNSSERGHVRKQHVVKLSLEAYKERKKENAQILPDVNETGPPLELNQTLNERSHPENSDPDEASKPHAPKVPHVPQLTKQDACSPASPVPGDDVFFWDSCDSKSPGRLCVDTERSTSQSSDMSEGKIKGVQQTPGETLVSPQEETMNCDIFPEVTSAANKGSLFDSLHSIIKSVNFTSSVPNESNKTSKDQHGEKKSVAVPTTSRTPNKNETCEVKPSILLKSPTPMIPRAVYVQKAFIPPEFAQPLSKNYRDLPDMPLSPCMDTVDKKPVLLSQMSPGTGRENTESMVDNSTHSVGKTGQISDSDTMDNSRHTHDTDNRVSETITPPSTDSGTTTATCTNTDIHVTQQETSVPKATECSLFADLPPVKQVALINQEYDYIRREEGTRQIVNSDASSGGDATEATPISSSVESLPSKTALAESISASSDSLKMYTSKKLKICPPSSGNSYVTAASSPNVTDTKDSTTPTLVEPISAVSNTLKKHTPKKLKICTASSAESNPCVTAPLATSSHTTDSTTSVEPVLSESVKKHTPKKLNISPPSSGDRNPYVTRASSPTSGCSSVSAASKSPLSNKRKTDNPRQLDSFESKRPRMPEILEGSRTSQGNSASETIQGCSVSYEQSKIQAGCGLAHFNNHRLYYFSRGSDKYVAIMDFYKEIFTNEIGRFAYSNKSTRFKQHGIEPVVLSDQEKNTLYCVKRNIEARKRYDPKLKMKRIGLKLSDAMALYKEYLDYIKGFRQSNRKTPKKLLPVGKLTGHTNKMSPRNDALKSWFIKIKDVRIPCTRIKTQVFIPTKVCVIL